MLSLTRATLINPSFKCFSELGKCLKYSLRLTLKNLNFESKDGLKNYVLIWVSLLKVKRIYIKKGWPHFKPNRWNIQFPLVLIIFQGKWIEKKEFLIGGNSILKQLGVLCITDDLAFGKTLLVRLYL